MNLWIRSQDNLQLLKVEDLEVYDGGNKANNHFFIKCLGNYIGEYKSKERALEVLDEIQQELTTYVGTTMQIVYDMPKE